MRDAPEIVYEQLGVDINGIPQYGPPGTTPDYSNAIERPTFWQTLLAFLGTAIAAIWLYPGA